MLAVTGTEQWIDDAVFDEAAIVAQARDDPAAFAPLYGRYLEPVYRYCYRRLGNQQAAEDVTSLVFSRALAHLKTYRDGSFRGWLFTIAHHAVIDELRSGRQDVPFDTAPDAADTASTPEELALRAEARQSLRGILAQLSPDQQRVVELHLAGLNGREIAGVLGRSHAAVRAIQSRAIARLRDLLRAESNEGEAP